MATTRNMSPKLHLRACPDANGSQSFAWKQWWMNQALHSLLVKVSEIYVIEGLVIAWLILKGFRQSRRQEKAFIISIRKIDHV